MLEILLALFLLYYFGKAVFRFFGAIGDGKIIKDLSPEERRKFLLLLAGGSFLLALYLFEHVFIGGWDISGELSLLVLLLSCVILPVIGVAAGFFGLSVYQSNDARSAPYSRIEYVIKDQPSSQTRNRVETKPPRITLVEIDASIQNGVTTFTAPEPDISSGVEQDRGNQEANGSSYSKPIDLSSVVALINLAATSRKSPQRTHVRLRHRLDAQARNRLSHLDGAFEKLYKSDYVWNISNATMVYADWLGDRRIQRERQLPRRAELSFMTVDVEHNGFQLRENVLMFLPDHVYSYIPDQGMKAHNYSSVTIEASSVEFTESRYYVRDAQILWSTWLYTRKDGGPDRRYKDNPMISRVIYGLITIQLGQSSYWELLVTSVQRAEEFRKLFYESQTASGFWSDSNQKKKQENTDQRHEHSWPHTDLQARTYFAVLGLDIGATGDEVRTAYRKLAKMNHPDLVSGLDPRLRDLAETRMKEINEAYYYIRKHLVD